VAATRKTEDEIGERLGKEGDTCAQCGTKLAVDQRYCLNCGTPRAQPRLDYQSALAEGDGAAESKASGSTMQWSPLLAIVAIAILGVMLLLGVLIGQGNNNNDLTVTEVPATATTGAATPTASVPTNTTTTPTTTPTTTSPQDNGSTTTTPLGKDQGAAGGIAPND
jgi:ribosomal protein L37E